MATKYQYFPLPSARHIRLLVINSGAHFDDISCRLLPVSLDIAPNYEALSYVWGNPNPRRAIHCSDGDLEIGPSLSSALRHLRRPDRDRIIWADAICINQDDVQEKSVQVQLMGEIYSTAARTLIWFGEGNAAYDDALRSLLQFQDLHKRESLADDVKVSESLVEAAGRTRENFALSAELLSQLAQLQDGLPYNGMQADEFFQDLFNRAPEGLIQKAEILFQNPWFGRKWIIQELVRSKHAVVMIGPKEFPWNIAQNFAIAFKQANFLTRQEFGDKASALSSNACMLSFLRADWNRGTPQRAASIARTTAAFTCADPRDHVIALLGISSGLSRRHIAELADCSVSPEEISYRFAKVCITACQDLTPLSMVSFQPLEDRPVSWVPRFDKLSPGAERPLRIFISSETEASGNSKIQASVSDNGATLTLVGRIIDAVERQTQTPMKDGVAELRAASALKAAGDLEAVPRMFKQRKLWWDDCRDIALNVNMTMTSNPEEYYLRTIQRDIFARIPNDELAKFEQFLQFYLEKSVELIMDARFDVSIEEILQQSFALDRLKGRFKVDRLEEELVNYFFCRTQDGRLGWMPLHTKKGDQICIFDGAKVPHVIRRSERGTFKLIGECYVQGLMNGEVLALAGLQREEISLA
jgi:hypothetical protein